MPGLVSPSELTSFQEWTLQLPAGVPDSDEDAEGGDMEAEADGAQPWATRISTLQQAYEHPDALTILHLCNLVLGDVTELIVDSSAEGEHVPSNLFDRLNILGWKLEGASTEDNATLVMYLILVLVSEFVFITLTCVATDR